MKVCGLPVYVCEIWRGDRVGVRPPAARHLDDPAKATGTLDSL